MIDVRGGVRHRMLVLDPGQVLGVDPGDWADTMIVVLGGTLEVVCCSGRHARFPVCSVLTLHGVPARTLRNPGTDPVLLHLVARDR